MMNMTFFTDLPYFAYDTYVSSKSIFTIFTIFSIFMAVFGVSTTVWYSFVESLPDRRFPIPSKEQEITSEGPRCGHAARAPGPVISSGWSDGPCGP